MSKRHKRARIALVHPWFGWGGGEAVLAWTIQALSGSYDITVLTHTPFSIQDMNTFYGTRVNENEVTISPTPYSSMVKLIRRLSLASFHLMMRYAKQRAFSFDLLISTSNEMDLGRPSVQYIHFPVLVDEAAKIAGALGDAWYHRESFVRRSYVRLCESLSGYSRERMKSNITLANSSWTAKLIEAVYHISPIVVYPPVPPVNDGLPWSQRENGFVCVARLAPEKRVERAITILREVRRHYDGIHLHIIGATTDTSYADRIKRMAQMNHDWVFIEGALSRAKLIEMLARHRYGIHTMPNEHFGIGVAEMVKAGCIVFVPASGGQVEVVGGEETLTFKGEREAIENIETVLSNPQLQQELRTRLARQAQVFSVQTFMVRVNEVVESALSREGIRLARDNHHSRR